MYSSPPASSPKLDGFVAAAPNWDVCSRKSLAVASPVDGFTVSATDHTRLDEKSAKKYRPR